jgi:acyl carrier protein
LIENALFPERDLWPVWANKDEGAGCKIRKIMELEAAGRLQWSRVDLSDDDQVEQFVKEVINNYGALHGVIHGADDVNYTGFNPLLELGNIHPEDYFGLKIKSIYNLKKALAPYRLDFLMLISSLAPVLGGFGQAFNAAQCAFLDNFALHEGAPWISVNWDIWRLTDQKANLQEGLYKDAIEPDEGIQAFLKIVTSYTGNRLVVSTTGLQQRISRIHNAHGNMYETPKDSSRVRRPRPDLKTPYAIPRNEVEKKLAASWEDCLGIENIGIDDDFFDLGGDSLISVNVMNQISSIFNKKIPAAILYQKATIRELSQLLAEEDPSSQAEKAEELNQRKEALSRRNQLLHKKHQVKAAEGEDDDE